MGQMSHKLEPHERQWAVEQYKLGYTPKKIAEALSQHGRRVTGTAISYLVKKAGVPRTHRPSVYPGSAGITLEKKREIVRAYFEREGRPSMKALAEEFGVGRAQVSAAIRLLGSPRDWCE